MPRRHLWPLLSLTLLTLSCAAYEYDRGPATPAGYPVEVSSAPQPPSGVFTEEPYFVSVPGTPVLIVENNNYDLFRYAGYIYLPYSGYWYRTRSANEPFVAVDERSVPQPVLTVPSRHWKRPRQSGS